MNGGVPPFSFKSQDYVQSLYNELMDQQNTFLNVWRCREEMCALWLFTLKDIV